jgi:hypothetical protein
MGVVGSLSTVAGEEVSVASEITEKEDNKSFGQ